VIMLEWLSMECVLEDESIHDGNIKTARNWFEDVEEQARVCRIVLCMSAGYYLRLASACYALRDF